MRPIAAPIEEGAAAGLLLLLRRPAESEESSKLYEEVLRRWPLGEEEEVEGFAFALMRSRERAAHSTL